MVLKDFIKEIKNIQLKTVLYFLIGVGLSFILIYFFTPEDFFKSPMYMLLPIVGFFATYYTTKYFMEYVEIKKKFVYLIFFIVIGVLGYYLAIFFYYWNIVNLNNIPFSELFRFVFGNNQMFLTSAYLGFLVSGVFGIIASK